jgi:predicted dinucleotide-binding enzyme
MSTITGTVIVVIGAGSIGQAIAREGSGVVIASQSGHRLPPLSAEESALLATTPAEELLGLPMPGPDRVTDSLHA